MHVDAVDASINELQSTQWYMKVDEVDTSVYGFYTTLYVEYSVPGIQGPLPPKEGRLQYL